MIAVLGPLWLVACGQRSELNIGDPCYSMPESLPGTVTVDVTQGGRAVAGSCDLGRDDGDDWLLETVYLFDRQPPFAGVTAALTWYTVECSAEVDGGDPWVVRFGPHTREVPVDGERHCFRQTYEGELEAADTGWPYFR